MRKFITTIIAIAVAGVAGNAFAVDGDFELSGHVNTAFGYQHYSNDAAALITGGAGANPVGGTLAQHGPLGRFATNSGVTAGGTQLVAVVDEFELNASKSFGENVRARADMSFGRVASGSGAVGLEQAYTTLNIPAGNGVEFLLGRFDAPIGFEANDRNLNTLWSHGDIYNYLRPTSLTGVKFYYPFSDMVDLHFYVANNLRDSLTVDSATPSFGMRLGFNWGDEGRRSTFGLSGAAGPEALDAGNKMDDWSYLADLDWNVWLSDSFAIGGEGIFRTDRRALAAGTDGRYFGGQLNLHYVFNDMWDGTVRYGYAYQRAGNSAGLTAGSSLLNAGSTAKTQLHEVSAGLQYHVADGAKLQLEGRYDLVNVAAATKGHVFGGVLGLLYSF